MNLILLKTVSLSLFHISCRQPLTSLGTHSQVHTHLLVEQNHRDRSGVLKPASLVPLRRAKSTSGPWAERDGKGLQARPGQAG